MTVTRFPNVKPEFRECLRKRRFTRNEALAAIERIVLEGKGRRYLYQCPHSKVVRHWHLTKDRQDGRR